MYRIHHCFIIVNDRSRTRTCNLRIRSPTPYPLGHTTTVGNRNHERSFLITFNSNGSCFWNVIHTAIPLSVVLWLRWQSACLVSRRSRVRVSLGPIIDIYNYEIKFFYSLEICLPYKRHQRHFSPCLVTQGWRCLLINKARNMFFFLNQYLCQTSWQSKAIIFWFTTLNRKEMESNVSIYTHEIESLTFMSPTMPR